MVKNGALDELTIDTFRRNAIRSVVLIDEEFPTYQEIGTQDHGKMQADLAASLYREFRDAGLLCDVENDVEKAKGELTSQITKSDLVILDLHLQGGTTDSSDALEILRRLADSEQFNLVIVYTADERLGEVGRRLAASLRGQSQNDMPPETEDRLSGIIAEVSDDLPQIPNSLVDELLLGKRLKDREIAEFKRLVAQKCGADKKLMPLVVEHFVNRELVSGFKAEFKPEKRRELQDGNLASENPWFTCGSVLVVVANKKHTPPGDGLLLKLLDETLVAWNPGIVRCVLSEIQNCIHSSGLPYRSIVASDGIMQLGWLLHAIEDDKKACASRSPAVLQLVERVLGGLVASIGGSTQLVETTKELIGTVEWKDEPSERVKELCSANGMAGLTAPPQFQDVLHALNQFLSIENFSPNETYLTTGTVVRCESKGMDEWWLCVEPACDTVPQQAGEDRFLRLRLLRLHPVKQKLDALKIATQSRFVFLEADGSRLCFDTRNRSTDQHELAEVFVKRDDQIDRSGASPTVKFWRTVTTGEAIEFFVGVATPVAQLRRPNADRFLHEAGYHQSRIGVDFVNCSEADASSISEASQR